VTAREFAPAYLQLGRWVRLQAPSYDNAVAHCVAGVASLCWCIVLTLCGSVSVMKPMSTSECSPRACHIGSERRNQAQPSKPNQFRRHRGKRKTERKRAHLPRATTSARSGGYLTFGSGGVLPGKTEHRRTCAIARHVQKRRAGGNRARSVPTASVSALWVSLEGPHIARS
jgi:hypothetical protein